MSFERTTATKTSIRRKKNTRNETKKQLARRKVKFDLEKMKKSGHMKISK